MSAVEFQTPEGAMITPQEALMLGATSLRMYGKLFFPKTFRQESPAFHDEIGTQLYENHRYNAFEVFRDGAKTSLLRVFTSQRIAYAISRTIMYVSSSQTHSSFSLRWLKRQVEYNKGWAQLFGLRKGNVWTNEILEIFHGVDETPITILAVGITGQIRGFNLDDYRPDLIIADDVQTDENVATAEQREKLKSIFFGALANSLSPASDTPHAKIVLLNTPMEKDDLIETCMADPLWMGKRFGIFDEAGNSRWEARWPTATMKREKEFATKSGRYSIWMREKECQIVKREHKTFDSDNLRYWDVLPSNFDEVIQSIDPASADPDKSKQKVDDNVVMTCGYKGPDVFVLEYSAEKGEMPDATAAHWYTQTLNWRPIKLAVESVGFQRTLAWYIEQEMHKRRMYVPIQRWQTGARSKNDRIIQAISGLLAFRRIWIKPGMEKLIKQLDDFNPLTDKNEDDVIDALSINIAARNPHMWVDERTIEQEMRRIDEEEDQEYERLEFRGCP